MRTKTIPEPDDEKKDPWLNDLLDTLTFEDAPGSVGRPTKYTRANLAKVFGAMNGGSTQRMAGLYAGVGEDTLCQWKREKPNFSDAIAYVENRFNVRLAALATKHAAKSFSACAWLLAKRLPNEFGAKVDAAPVAPVLYEPLTDAARAAVVAGLLQVAMDRAKAEQAQNAA